jgi:histidine triad (HIT) family protein
VNQATCIFCEIIAARAEGTFIYRDAVCAAFLDIQPVNPGHVLIVPVRHVADLRATHPEEWSKVADLGRTVAAALRASDLKCEGVNLFLADGASAGQEVFHTHLHVFPRFKGDGFGLRFPESYRDLPPRRDLEAVADLIRARLDPRMTGQAL